MGKGLLAWWRRSIVSRGLAGAALFSIPVAVAALIGFGTGLSSVAGGLTAVTSGPDAVPASVQTTPTKLNNAVVALANRPSRPAPEKSDVGSPQVQGSNPDNGVSVQEPGNGDSGGGGTNTNPSVAPTISNPLVPPLDVHPTGGNVVGDTTGNAVNQVNGTVDNLLSPLTDTLNTLLGNK
jgi:hypothetical protein